MTRVDFYVLPEAEDVGPVLLACRLCEKAAGDGLKVHVHVPDAALAEDIDAALWSFRQGSFIAHERSGGAEPPSPLAAVTIGAGEPPTTHQDVLINLADGVPPFFSRCERVLEIVSGDTEARARSRDRFKFYRERGYELQTHKL
jgi:DNA polymerase-3 subunit chi